MSLDSSLLFTSYLENSAEAYTNVYRVEQESSQKGHQLKGIPYQWEFVICDCGSILNSSFEAPSLFL